MHNYFSRIRNGFVVVVVVLLLSIMQYGSASPKKSASNPPIYISFLWHMHQPIYWPYESVVQTDQNGRYGYSVADIHNQRTGPYTSWPASAVQKGISAGLPHFGAQVSFSGSLIENLNNLEAAGNGNFSNWKSSWNSIRTQSTSLGNPRLDMVAFGYFHPLMGLIDQVDIARQIELHKAAFTANFPGRAYSKGIFPPENAFSPRMIPALVQEGIQWALVDNVHFDRACQGYPFSTVGNLYEPNKADIRNPDPGDWVALNGLWAPTRNSARWGRQPHYVQYVDPNDGSTKKIIAVPGDRFMGNEDGRGGFGALNYDYVMSQLESYNTDPSHPILIVLPHDGDNYGGGSESYYNSNFQSFVNWLLANPSRFVCTTVQDYLDMFPPDPNDVIHVEDGSWSGADNGDPEFLKWNGDPSSGYSPDRNSWGVVTAAKNYVLTAQQINPTSANTTNAWKYMTCAEASDYWYWDGSQNGLWDSHPTRACNQAVQYAQAVTSSGTDLTPPTIYIPQREPYNPGGTEWTIAKPSDFTVWTYAFDVSGLSSVVLHYRTDGDGTLSTANDTYAGGAGVGAWTDLAMTSASITPQTNPLPTAKALEYSAQITGKHDVMIDYYVEAIDAHNNVGRSPIRHVWVGQSYSGGINPGNPAISWVPQTPTTNDSITITVTNATQGAKLHWGVNNSGSSWQQPNSAYWPTNSVLFGGTGPAVESPFNGPDTGKNLTLKIGPFNNPVQAVTQIAFDIHYNDGSWNNNGGSDYHITVSGGGTTPVSYTMDGAVDASAQMVASNAGLSLYCDQNGTDFYIATQSASSQGGDMFVFIANTQKALAAAPWAKAGQVAGWKMLLANESSNNWNGWFDSAGVGYTGSGTAHTANGSILEGTVNLQTIFGYIPSTLYVAVGKYGTADAGALSAQAPAGNGNGSIEAAEYYTYVFTGPPAPPAVPVLAAPANNAIDQSLSLTFTWHPDSGATLYHLQVSTDSLFGGSFILNDSSITDTQKTVFGLAQHRRLFWRLQAKNAGGVSDWSETRRFTTLLQSPSAVTLVAPANGAAPATDTLAFSWRAAQYEVTSYNLVITADSAAGAVRLDTTLNDTGTVVHGFSWNRNYYWKVRAMNAAGWGAFSAANSFIPTHLFPPDVPILAAPLENATDVPFPVLLNWRPAAGATSYSLQVAGDSVFGTLFVVDSSIADTQKTIAAGNLLVHHRFFWRLRAKNAGGVSAWTDVRRFTTILPPPSTVALVAPGNSALVMSDTIAFSWRVTLNEVSAYNIVINSGSAGGPVSIDSTRADTSIVLSGFAWDSTYYWKVRAMNASGWGAFSAARSFIPMRRSSITANVAVAMGWNMVSNPVFLSNDSVQHVFSGAVTLSNLFSYTGSGYTTQFIMPNGKGFWLKLRDSGIVPVAGLDIIVDSIPVAPGWNMVGSISYPVDTSAVVIEPDGIRLSPYFGYHNGYVSTQTIEPGKAYWIKVSGPGMIRLIHQPVVEARAGKK